MPSRVAPPAEPEKQAFLQTIAESVNLDEWVEGYYSPEQLVWLSHMDDWSGPEYLSGDPVLAHHWQRRDVYDAFTEEVWAAVQELGEEESQWNVVETLDYMGDAPAIITHEDFIDIMIMRAFSQVAHDLIDEES